MTLKECYSILQVAEGAGVDEIKKAYRKRAFELHPDLHPDQPDAAKRFQRLNEAYVILTKNPSGASASSRSARGSASSAAETESAREKARQAYSKAKKTFDQSARTSAKSSTQSSAQRASRTETQYHHKQEDVLNDILKDPFARRVFEDIYSQIRSEGGSVPIPKKRKLSFEWGESKLSFDVTHGVTSGVKGWLRKQLDDEQTIRLPAHKLAPGVRVRIHISQGLSEDKRQIEITLPSDFVVGRPIRLKGLGKKLGPWTGDLYLRILAKI